MKPYAQMSREELQKELESEEGKSSEKEHSLLRDHVGEDEIVDTVTDLREYDPGDHILEYVTFDGEDYPADTRFLTLSTCGYEFQGARIVLVCLLTN